MSEMIEEEEISVDEESFLSNIRAKMKSKSTHFNTPGRRKKIISTKLCNVSMGSISKESLRGKNRVLALDVQKAKITLGNLNQKYIKLQQENQDDMILLNKKRMEKNDLQKIYERDTKIGIEKATEKIDIMLNRYLTELIVNSTTLDMKKRTSLSSRSPTQASKSQPNCLEKNKVDRIDRKTRRSRLSLDQKLAASQPVKPSENTKQFNEKMCYTNSVTNKGRHPSSVVIKAPSFAKPVQQTEETFLAIPIGMMPDLVDENLADDDVEMTEDFNQTFQPLNLSVCDLTSESDNITTSNISKQTKNKRPQKNKVFKNAILSKDSNLQQEEIKLKEKHTSCEEAPKTLEPTISLEVDSKEKPANKLLLTSRDRTKICNVRDMIIPKPKVKSKSRKKEVIKVPEKTKSSPSKIPVFDFSMQSPTIELPESYKEIPENIQLPGGDRNSTELIKENKPVKSKSRSKVKDSSDNQSSKSSPVSSKSDSQLLKKIKSLSKGQSKKSKECSDLDGIHSSKSDFHLGQNGLSVQDTSGSPTKEHTDNPKERLGQSKSHKLVLQDTTNGETYTVPMKTGSPEQQQPQGIEKQETQKRGRSRSRGNTLKNSDTTEHNRPQTYSPTKNCSEDTMRSRSRSRKRTLKVPNDGCDSNTADDSTLSDTVPMKMASPEKATADKNRRGRSRSCGRTLKEADTESGSQPCSSSTCTVPLKLDSPEKSTKPIRGGSRSRARVIKEDNKNEEVPLLLDKQEETSTEKQSTSRSKRRSIFQNEGDIKPTEDKMTHPIGTKEVTRKIEALKNRLGIDKDGKKFSSETDKQSTESEKFREYSVPLKSCSPEEKLVVRRGRSRSRGRPKAQDEMPQSTTVSERIEGLKDKIGIDQVGKQFSSETDKQSTESEKFREYSVPLKTCSPEEKLVVRRGRSRSRGRPKTQDETPQSTSVSERSRSKSRGRNKLPEKIEGLKDRLGIDKDGKQFSSETDKQLHVTESEKFREYSVPLKTCSPEEKLVVRRGRSRSRGRPKAQDETPQSTSVSERSRSKSRGRNKLSDNDDSDMKSLKNCVNHQLENVKRSLKRDRSQNRKGCERLEISDSESDEIVRSPAPKRRSRSRVRKRPGSSENSKNSDALNGGQESNDLNPNSVVKSPLRDNIKFEIVPKIVVEDSRKDSNLPSQNLMDLKTKTAEQVSEDSICTVFKNRPSIKSSKKSLVTSSPSSSQQSIITPDLCPLVKLTTDGRKSSLNNRTSTSKRTVDSIGSRDSLDVVNGERKSRRAAASVSYKEPTLNSKLRREDVQKKLLEKEVEKKRLSGQEKFCP